MTYKSILVHLDNSQELGDRVRVAATIALDHKAHLIGLAPSGIAHIPGDAYFEPATRLATELQQQRDNAAQVAVDEFNAVCKEVGVDSTETRIVGNEPTHTVLLHSLYNDLVIIGQSGLGNEWPITRAGFVEQIVLGAGKPVLIVPYVGASKPVGRKIMLAWDASREAARAVDAAMPMLANASEVEVVVINSGAPVTSKHGPAPGTDIALFLARHGVTAKVKVLTTAIDIGNTMLSHVADSGADMIVMGGYGHSRLREWVMGGATRMLIDTMTVPVLMAH